MGQRILIQVDESQPALPPDARRLLESYAATSIRRSHAELPGLYTAVLSTPQVAGRVVAALRATPGIRDAALDEMRTTLDG